MYKFIKDNTSVNNLSLSRVFNLKKNVVILK